MAEFDKETNRVVRIGATLACLAVLILGTAAESAANVPRLAQDRADVPLLNDDPQDSDLKPVTGDELKPVVPVNQWPYVPRLDDDRPNVPLLDDGPQPNVPRLTDGPSRTDTPLRFVLATDANALRSQLMRSRSRHYDDIVDYEAGSSAETERSLALASHVLKQLVERFGHSAATKHLARSDDGRGYLAAPISGRPHNPAESSIPSLVYSKVGYVFPVGYANVLKARGNVRWRDPDVVSVPEQDFWTLIQLAFHIPHTSLDDRTERSRALMFNAVLTAAEDFTYDGETLGREGVLRSVKAGYAAMPKDSFATHQKSQIAIRDFLLPSPERETFIKAMIETPSAPRGSLYKDAFGIGTEINRRNTVMKLMKSVQTFEALLSPDQPSRDRQDGCGEIVLSPDEPQWIRQGLSFTKDLNACFVIDWSGVIGDKKIPQIIHITALQRYGRASGRAGFDLAADLTGRTWDFETLADSDLYEKKLWQAYRMPVDLIAEAGERLRSWELILTPDAVFADKKMTFAMGYAVDELSPGEEPPVFDLIIGPGMHKVQPSIRMALQPEENDDPSCKSPLLGTPPVPSSLTLLEQGRTFMGSEGESSSGSATPVFTATYLMNAPDINRCADVLAVGASEGGAALANMFGISTGNASESAQSDGVRYCQALLESEIDTALGALDGLTPDSDAVRAINGRKIEMQVRVTPRTDQLPLTVGTYPIGAEVDWYEPDLVRQGYMEPMTATASDGTFEILDMSDGHIHVRYDFGLYPEGGDCDSQLTGRMKGEIITPFAFPDQQKVLQEFGSPAMIMGEPAWRSLSPSLRREAMAEWRAEPAELVRDLTRETPFAPDAGADLSDADVQDMLGGVPDASCEKSQANTDRLVAYFSKDLPEGLRRAVERDLRSNYEDPDFSIVIYCQDLRQATADGG